MSNINMNVIIGELHRAYNFFNNEYYKNQLPMPIILVQSKGNRKNSLGWCTVRPIWKENDEQEGKYELNIVAEALNRGSEKVISTLLHEMAHLYNLMNGIKDVSRGGTYHNTKFKKTAESHGLEVGFSKSLGHSPSKLNLQSIKLLEKLKLDEQAFSIARIELKKSNESYRNKVNGGKKVKKNLVQYLCKCGKTVYSEEKVLIKCCECGESFLEMEE